VYLIDTMVLSEYGKRYPDPRVVAWFDAVEAERNYISVISLGEIAAGLANPEVPREAIERLQIWEAGLTSAFSQRTLAVTSDIAIRWGRLRMSLGRKDMDLLIAATALEHDLTLVTRNARHFEPTGVRLLNPYA
jgi:toxin FitB